METLSLNTFGDEKIRTRRCDEVQVKLKTLSKTMPINVLSFSKICTPLPLKLDVESYPHLNGLEIADASLVTDSPSERLTFLLGPIITIMLSRTKFGAETMGQSLWTRNLDGCFLGLWTEPLALTTCR